MPRRFVGIPTLPTENVPPGQVVMLNAIKQNLEMLVGVRGNGGDAAVVRSDITIRMPAKTLNTTTALGGALDIGGVQVAAAQDYAKLISDVRGVIAVVNQHHDIIEALIRQLKGT
jgi:hypothetical protein